MKKLVSVLEEMMNPKREREQVEMDSIYQLKILIKNFYEKKGDLGKKLLQKLDALMSDRP